MTITEIDPEDIVTAGALIPKDSSVIMLNLVRYNERAEYGDRTDITPCSGREAYLQRYAPAFNRVAEAEGVQGISVLYLGTVAALLVAQADEHWDEIALVEYPSFVAFRRVVDSPRYAMEAAIHRQAALKDWRLIATLKPVPMA